LPLDPRLDRLEQRRLALPLVEPDQVDVVDGAEEALRLEVLDPDRNDEAGFSVRVGAEGRCPLGLGEARFEIGAGDDGNRPLRVAGGPVHVEGEVPAREEVPGLEDDGVAVCLQHVRDPFGPAAIGSGIADEEVLQVCCRFRAHEQESFF
jgi:hypothetical protein